MKIYSSSFNLQLCCRLNRLQSCTICTLLRLFRLRLAANRMTLSIYGAKLSNLLLPVCMVFFPCTVTAVDLQNNPFRIPAYLSTDGNINNGKSATAKAIDLRGIIFAGDKSIINVAGEFYVIGDSIGDYTLLAVRVGSAVFLKDNEEVIVTVGE